MVEQVTVDPSLLGAVRWWLAQDNPPTPEHMAYTYCQVIAPGVLASLGLD